MYHSCSLTLQSGHPVTKPPCVLGRACSFEKGTTTVMACCLCSKQGPAKDARLRHEGSDRARKESIPLPCTLSRLQVHRR